MVMDFENLSLRLPHNFSWSCTAANWRNFGSKPSTLRAFSSALAALIADFSLCGSLKSGSAEKGDQESTTYKKCLDT